MLEFLIFAIGLITSYILKEIQFLSLEFHFLNTGLIYPDFVLIFIVFFSLHRKEFFGIWIGFFGGLLEDGSNWILDEHSGYFSAILGVHSSIYAIIGYTVGRLSQYFEKQHSVQIIFLILITVIISRFFTWSLYVIVDNFNRNYPILGTAIYSALIAPICFTLLAWVYRSQFNTPK